MANDFYNRGANFNPDELADGDAIEAEFNAVSRGFDTIEDLVNANKAGYPTQTFHVATATAGTHAVPKAQMDAALGFKLDAVNYNATDVLSKLKTVDGSGSGVDADLLDGKDGSYYRNATNINAGTLAKERLPISIDASTTGNAATATQTTATAAAGASADLVKGFMGGNDFFRIRVGGNTDAGWTELATADDGNEPIYVRQYTGDFASITRTLTLLDASGNSGFPGTITATQLNGNAATATKLATARQINGVNFDGTGNITVADSTKLPLAGGNITGEISFTPTSGTVMSFGATPVIRRFTGAHSMSMGVGGDDTLLLGAGESVGIMAANLTLGSEEVHVGADTNIFLHVSSDNWATWAGKNTFSIDATNGPLWNGGKVWNAGNDGAGSGLDADLLDGQEGAYYRNAANLNAGILPDARLSGTYTGVSITGNAATATMLQTARTINGVSFNGSANITVEPYVEQDTGTNAARYLTFVDSSTAGYQRLNLDTELTFNPSTNTLTCSVSGNASTASKLATARTITLTGDVTGSVAFDGSANATITAALSDAGVLASVATSEAGGVGTYVFGYINNGAAFADGVTYAGSSIKPAAIQKTLAAATVYGGYRSASTLSGTWRAMGAASANYECNFTLFLRIS